MPAILPSINVDSDKDASRYFLPYQLIWIADDSQMRLVKKSVRIGWTYGDAFKNVRKRLRHKQRDYLFVTKDQATAFEYVEQCKRFCEIYKLTKSILSHGVDDLKVPRFDEHGRDTGLVDEVKVGYIKFDNQSRILAFSSNPNATRAFGGDVGLDEYAFHPRDIELWAAAQGRVTWGFDIGVWSSCNGDDTKHEEFCRDAEAGKGGWSYYKITMEDAVELGLVEKINQTSGRNMTHAEFLADCRTRARLQEVYDQDYDCKPRGGTNPIVSWSSVSACRHDYKIERLHLEARQIEALFGRYDRDTAADRIARIENFLLSAFPNLFSTPRRNRGGFDVAASGVGDLASIYIDEHKADGSLQLRALFTCRIADDWPFLRAAVYAFLGNLSDVHIAGDETGLGRQICREAALDFPGQFTCVNFKSDKSDLGALMMDQLSGGEKIIPKSDEDIACDFFAVRKLYQGGRWSFSEGSNPHNEASHCDIFWSGALSSRAAAVAVSAIDLDPDTTLATGMRTNSFARGI